MGRQRRPTFSRLTRICTYVLAGTPRHHHEVRAMFVIDNAIGATAVRQPLRSTHAIRVGSDVSIFPHAGQLTDRDILREVITALERNSLVPEGKVWVSVANGWVTLKGQVDGNYERAGAKKTVGD